MKKIYFLITGLLFCGTVMQGQNSIDLKVGLSTNSIIKPDFSSNAVVEPRTGWAAAAVFPLIKWRDITVNTGAEILEKNYLWHRTGTYSGVYEAHRNIYASVPVSQQVTVIRIKRLKAILNAGIVYSYCLARRTDGATPNAFDTSAMISAEGEVVQNFYLTSYTVKNDFRAAHAQRQELSVVTGVLIRYENSGRVIPTLSINYYQGLTSVTRDASSKLFHNANSTLAICCGVFIKLKRS